MTTPPRHWRQYAALAALYAAATLLCRAWFMGDTVDYAVEALRFDLQFHRKLIDITGNEVIRNLMEVIHEFVRASMMHTTPKPRDRNWSRPLHRAILDAVRSANPDAAEEAMRAHMEAVVRRLKAAGRRK